MNVVRQKTSNTLKSKNDEQANQALLKRIRNISVIGEKKTVLPKTDRGDTIDLARCLTFEKLGKLIKLHTSDPLIWNVSILSRIFKIREDYCDRLVNYVRPMVYLSTSRKDETKQLVNNPVVIDVARLKTDDDYLVIYKRIVFPEQQQKLPQLALQDSDKKQSSLPP